MRRYLEGQNVTSYNGDYFVGSDGDYYYSSARHYIVYDSDGNVSVRYTNGGGKRRHDMIDDGSGDKRTVYCIESGIDYDDGNTYTSVNGQNSAYLWYCAGQCGTELYSIGCNRAGDQGACPHREAH